MSHFTVFSKEIQIFMYLVPNHREHMEQGEHKAHLPIPLLEVRVYFLLHELEFYIYSMGLLYKVALNIWYLSFHLII